jgi:hypothetical protein
MLFDVSVYLIIITGSYLAWTKYIDKFLNWCFWIGIIGLGAVLCEYLIQALFPFPSLIEFGSLVAIESLRIVMLILLVVAGIRIYKHRP